MLIAVDIASLELDVGPDPQVLAISEFHEAPGPGVALVDLNGEGMLYTESVWMDDSGRVTAAGWGTSGTGLTVSDGAVSVTGRATASTQVVVQAQHSMTGESFEFVVTPTAEGWYAGCRPPAGRLARPGGHHRASERSPLSDAPTVKRRLLGVVR